MWILWLIFETKTQFADLSGDAFLDTLWRVLHKHYHDAVPRIDVDKLIRRRGIHFAHVVDIKEGQWKTAFETQPEKPKTKKFTGKFKVRPSADKISTTCAKARDMFYEAGTTFTLFTSMSKTSVAGPATSRHAQSTSTPTTTPASISSTSVRLSSSSTLKRPHPPDLPPSTKRQKSEKEPDQDWLSEVLHMTLRDFTDIVVIGKNAGAIDEKLDDTVEEFLELPPSARAKNVADPEAAIKVIRAANDAAVKRSKFITRHPLSNIRYHYSSLNQSYVFYF